MPTTIVKIELIELQRFKSGRWVDLLATELIPATYSPLKSVTVYSSETGFDPAVQRRLAVNWADISGIREEPGDPETKLTIFAANETNGLIATTSKSIRIRYRIKATDSTTPAVETESSGYYYSVLNLAFPAAAAASGLPATDATSTQSIAATIVVPVAAFLDATVDGDSAAQLHEYLKDPKAWKFIWTPPTLEPAEIKAEKITIDDPTATAAPEYGGYAVKVKHELSLPIDRNGDYDLLITFNPNDGDAAVEVITLTCTVSGVTENVGSQSVKVVWSTDTVSGITVKFTKAVA